MLDARGQPGVTGDAVALGNGEDTRPVPTKPRQGRHEGRTLVNGGHAAHTRVDVPRSHRDALAGRPCLDARPLGVGAKLLLVSSFDTRM
jgi:hypothetical protein